MTEAEFNITYKQYYKGLLFLAKRLVGEVGEDFVSVAFVKLWELGDHPNHIGFLITTVKNDCLNHNKHEKRKYFIHKKIKHNSSEEDIMSNEYADSLVMIADMINFINSKINSLPPAEKKVFDLLYMKQLSTNDAAKTLNISVDTIRVLKMRLDKDFKFLGAKIFNKNSWYCTNGVYQLSKRYSR